MTQSAYANATINNMLGWLKGFATWVLRIFNLAGRGNISPFTWLAENWLQLLIILLVAGIAIDLIVWLIRWRPYWIWFRKKRILIEDENFFSREEALEDEPDDSFERELFGGDEEPEEKPRSRRRESEPEEGASEFVVASTVVQRGSRAFDRSGEDDSRYRRPSTIVTRDTAVAPLPDNSEPETDIFATDFDIRSAPVEWDEDDVFNVSDLPISEQPENFEPGPAGRRSEGARSANR